MGFWKKLGITVIIALVFGLVAGGCFSGVNYLANKKMSQHEITQPKEDIPKPETKEPEIEVTKPEPVIVNNNGANAIEITKECMPSVVAITNVSVQQYYSLWYGNQEVENTSAGSGIIVKEDDNYIYIVTNNHVISGANTLTVKFYDDEAVEAEVKGASASTDLAVVTVPKSELKTSTKESIKVASMGDSSALVVGQECVAIGNAMGYGQSVTKGIISALNREVKVKDPTTGVVITNELIQTDAAINPGNSGGALLDENGSLIGINSVKFTRTSVEGMGYAIPINTVKPFINKFINNDVVDEKEQAFLGVAGVEVSQSVVDTYGIPSGLCISKVGEDTPAQRAGLEVGDIIIKVNGRNIQSMSELSEELSYLSAGATVPVMVAKKADGYSETTIDVVLGEKPEKEVIDESPIDLEHPSENNTQDDKTENSEDNPNIKTWEYHFNWPFSLFGF